MTDLYEREVARDVTRLRVKVAEAVMLACAEFNTGAIGRLLARSVVTRLDPVLVRVVRAGIEAAHMAASSDPPVEPDRGTRGKSVRKVKPRRPRPARPPVVGLSMEKSVRPRKLYAELAARGLQPVWKVTGSEEKPFSWRVTVTVFRPVGTQDSAFVLYRVSPTSGNLVISEFYFQEWEKEPRRVSSWAVWREVVFGWGSEVRGG